MPCFDFWVEGKLLQLTKEVSNGETVLQFQSLCRGEASATSLSQRRFYRYAKGFNPSVEGKPLQPSSSSSKKATDKGFNPSVEGKPLQLHPIPGFPVSGVLFQSLCRGEASAT